MSIDLMSGCRLRPFCHVACNHWINEISFLFFISKRSWKNIEVNKSRPKTQPKPDRLLPPVSLFADMEALSAIVRPSTHLDSTSPTPCPSLKPTPHRRPRFLLLGDFHDVGQLASSHPGRVRSASHGDAQNGGGEAAFGNGYGLLSCRGDVQVRFPW